MSTIPTTVSLLKYDRPVLLSEYRKASSKRRPLDVSLQKPVICGPIPPPPKPKDPSADAIQQQQQEILNAILPPKEWMENNQVWVQQVSNRPCTRTDVINLEEELDHNLQHSQARYTGVCPARRELHTQCFDEIIRQVTLSCYERGLLLLRVRDEIRMTLTAYKTLLASSVAYGIGKALQAEAEMSGMEKIADLENQKRELERQVNEQIAKCEATQKREDERRQVEEKKRAAEICSLERSNEQLKAQLDVTMIPEK